MQALTWYVNRLGRMSAPEVAWRAASALRKVRRTFASRRSPRPSLETTGHVFIHIPPDLDAAPYVQAAERLMRGEHDVFDLVACQLGETIEWNRDPLSGRRAPVVAAALIDYRDESSVGNIKYLWEPNRHLHLVTLAQAFALTGELDYAHELREQVDGWIAQCPPGRGANWTSALELGIRLINWSIAWQLIGGAGSPVFEGEAGEQFRARWLDSIYQHVKEVSGNYSRFSSANNHLIGEAAGVFIASVTWPFWPAFVRHGAVAKAILGRECVSQNAPDGGNREQAFSYQQFVLDFLLLAGLAARSCGDDFPAGYWERLESMAGFIAALMDAGHHLPAIGDADDGYVTRIDPAATCDRFRSLLATAGSVFHRDDFLQKAALQEDAKTLWLLGAQRPLPETGRATQDWPRAFPDSGYYVLAHAQGTADEIRLIVDAGPLGYLSLAAHGHADSLAVVLSVGGHEVLVDPGTYCYHTEPAWRRYFRSTRAHNTVSIDHGDQSQQEGSFMWSAHARSRCLEFNVAEKVQRFRGEHEGYLRLPDPVRHLRSIAFDEGKREFMIEDRIDCRSGHVATRHWHFAPGVVPEVERGRIVARAGEWRVTFTSGEAVESRVSHGGSHDEGGWYSGGFHRKEPISSVDWRLAISGETVMRTLVKLEKA